VLLSGHHANIDAWRKEERIKKTKERRPDMWQAYLDKGDDKNG
jgi:tRNA (guanine37-N1)-methyltransferase